MSGLHRNASLGRTATLKSSIRTRRGVVRSPMATIGGDSYSPCVRCQPHITPAGQDGCERAVRFRDTGWRQRISPSSLKQLIVVDSEQTCSAFQNLEKWQGCIDLWVMAKPSISDELWSVIEPLSPPERPKPKGGRPVVPPPALP